MKGTEPTSWATAVKAGDALLVIKHTRLWPIEMWYSAATDEDTILVTTPIVTPGDICGVLDTLSDDQGKVYAALVVCSEGFGCVLADLDHLRPL